CAPRERLYALLAACDEISADLVVVDDALERGSESVLVRRLDEQRGIARNFWDRTGARGDDRHACRHRFENGKAEPFGNRRLRKGGGVIEEGPPLAIGDTAEDLDSVARRDVEAVDGAVERGPGRTVVARDDQPQIAVARCQLTERADEM